MRRLTIAWVAISAGVFSAPAATAAAEQADFKKGETVHGFTFVERRAIPEIDAVGLRFEHEGSGAELVKFACDDPNKSFAITFKTPPEGDYGIPHILEHSVLDGSEKFPVKSPFQVLTKGSLNTFLNAMTASDFTMYPVASTNTKDFFNLVNVYLDAVLNPLVHDNPKIFLQEGWRYELASPEAPLEINGIVYNEMKGAFSAPERVLGYVVEKALFPDSPYGLSSGGHPQAIPELERQQLLDFHRKYYHPSNARITLWGDGDTRAELKFIHEQYLKNYKVRAVAAAIPQQPPFEALAEVEAVYPVGADEDPADKTFLSLAWVAGGPQDPAQSMALDVLTDVLVNRPASPLRSALEQAGIGKDSYAYYSDTKQGVLQLVVKNANPDDARRFRKLVFAELGRLAEQGLDKRLIEGVINKLEFRLREADYGSFPKGLVYTFFGIRGWLFADDPFLGVAYEAPLAEVRQALESDLLEKLIRRHLLDNPHGVLAVVKPQPGLEAERSAQRKAALAEKKAAMKPARIARIVEQTKALEAYQAKPDDPENLAKIPMLSLEDLDREERAFPVTEHRVDGVRLLHSEQATNGIIYLQLLFDVRGLAQELLPHAALLAQVLGELDTSERSYGALDTELSIHTGGLDYGLRTYLELAERKDFQPKLAVSGKVLSPKLERLLELTAEVLRQTRFDDRERLREVLGKIHSRYAGMARRSGVYLAMQRLMAYLGAEGAFDERTGGLHFIHFLSEQVAHYDERAEGLLADLAFVAQILFDRHNLVLGVTCSSADLKRVKEQLPGFLARVPSTERKPQQWQLALEHENEGLAAASKVQYVVQGADFRNLGHAHSGHLEVAERILSREYLTDQIRVQGGAYGAWSQFGRSGLGLMSSYRDPHLKRTFEVYDGAVDYLKGFQADPRMMTRFIIGAIAGRDKPGSPAGEGARAIAYALQGLEQATRQAERDQILGAKPADIRALAPLVEAVLGAETFCVYGNETKLQQNAEMFSRLVEVLE